MFQLVYASTAATLFSDGELLGMLDQYREKNARLDITGMLLYKQGAFMQALEGEEGTVRSLYATIRADPRHHHVLTLVALPVAKRQFPNWTMGFSNLDHPVAGATPGYQPRLDLPPPHDELSWQASVAMSLLTTFSAEN